MKFGINFLLWTGNFVNEQVNLFPRMKKMGYDGVELPINATEGLDTRLVRRALHDNGLGCTFCSVMPSDGSLIDPDPANRQKGVDHLKCIIDIAAEVGCETICGPMYSPVGLLVGRGRNEVEWSHAVNAYKEIMPHAEQAKVFMAVEPLNRFETYFVNINSDVVKLVEEVGSDWMGLHYDTFHSNIEEKDPVAALKAAGKRVYHVHASENDRGIVGTGHVPWKETFATLKTMKYDRWVTVESFLPALKELAAAAAIWRELAPSAEVLAEESLKFMKSLV